MVPIRAAASGIDWSTWVLFLTSGAHCFPRCGSAPCLQVNADVYEEFVDEKKLDEIMDACKRGEVREWAK